AGGAAHRVDQADLAVGGALGGGRGGHQGRPGRLLVALGVLRLGQHQGGGGDRGPGVGDAALAGLLLDEGDPQRGVGDPHLGVGVAHGGAASGDAVGDVGRFHAADLGADALAVDAVVGVVELAGHRLHGGGDLGADGDVEGDVLAAAAALVHEDVGAGQAGREDDRERRREGGEGSAAPPPTPAAAFRAGPAAAFLVFVLSAMASQGRPRCVLVNRYGGTGRRGGEAAPAG